MSIMHPMNGAAQSEAVEAEQAEQLCSQSTCTTPVLEEGTTCPACRAELEGEEP